MELTADRWATEDERKAIEEMKAEVTAWADEHLVGKMDVRDAIPVLQDYVARALNARLVSPRAEGCNIVADGLEPLR